LGNSILYIGSERGILYLYNNIENNLGGAFTLVDSLNLHGLNVTVSGGDITGDGAEELIYGEYAGGIAILKQGKPSFLGIDEPGPNQISFKVYPNPATTEVNIETEKQGDYLLTMTNLLGRIIEQRSFTSHMPSHTMTISGVEPGLYIISLHTEKGAAAFQKVIVK
jgi:hypothetical protein